MCFLARFGEWRLLVEDCRTGSLWIITTPLLPLMGKTVSHSWDIFLHECTAGLSQLPLERQIMEPCLAMIQPDFQAQFFKIFCSFCPIGPRILLQLSELPSRPTFGFSGLLNTFNIQVLLLDSWHGFWFSQEACQEFQQLNRSEESLNILFM